MKKSLFFLLILVLFACKTKEEVVPETEVFHLQDLGTLGTVEYTFGKIVELNDNKDWYRIGDRKILMSVRAKVKAGVDLQKLKDDDIVFNDAQRSVEILLPPAEIISFEMHPNDIKTEMTDVTGFRFEFTQEDKLKVLKLGEEAIQKEMTESQIFQDAEKNTRVFIEDFYRELGYETVIVNFKPSLK